MEDTSNERRAIELLQQLGLKEYEAKSFVALSQRQQGTARDVSETSEVPRTRVYDATRVLESKGLVETQDSNPQQFRAVSIDEAVSTLRAEYEGRTESLREALESLEPVDAEDPELTHEIWGLSGSAGITSRTQQLIDDAGEEIYLVLGHGDVATDRLLSRLRAAHERGVDVAIGTVSEEIHASVQEALPDVEVFVSGLAWLSRSELPDDETEISRLLLVDREAILVSSYTESAGEKRQDEQAVYGRGFHNGIVAIVRRLVATGMGRGEGALETEF